MKPRSTFNIRRRKLTQAEEHELKKDIENLALLAKKVLTKPNDKTTSMNFVESKNALKYVKEVDIHEHPENYYHFQLGNYGIEIKKEKKFYKVCTYGFTIDRTQLNEDTGFIQKWTMGRILGQYYNENFEVTISNYINCIKQFFEFELCKKLEKIKDLTKEEQLQLL